MRSVATGLALALLVASTAGAVSDVDDDLDGDDVVDVCDLVLMASPPALVEAAPAPLRVAHPSDDRPNPGRDVAARIFHPPI